MLCIYRQGWADAGEADERTDPVRQVEVPGPLSGDWGNEAGVNLLPRVDRRYDNGDRTIGFAKGQGSRRERLAHSRGRKLVQRSPTTCSRWDGMRSK